MLVSDQVLVPFNIKYFFCYCRQNICSDVLCFVYRQHYIDIHTMTFINCHFTIVFLAFFIFFNISFSRFFALFVLCRLEESIFFLVIVFFFELYCLLFFHSFACSFYSSFPRILSLIIFFVFLSLSLVHTRFSLSLQIKYRQISFELVLHPYSNMPFDQWFPIDQKDYNRNFYLTMSYPVS